MAGLHGVVTTALGLGTQVGGIAEHLSQGHVGVDLAFVRSVNGINPITIEEWKKEWSEIERVISSMRLDLPNYEIELKEIEERLERGEYVGHHSQIFEECYSPHYRIISRDIFEQELLPLFKK